MRTKLFILPLLVLLLTSNLSPASGLAVPGGLAAPGTGSDPTQIGQLGGVTKAVAYDAGMLYFNVGPRIARMAVSATAPNKPLKPETVGGMLPGIPEDIKVANGNVYVAMGADGVAVVDASTLQVMGVQQLPTIDPALDLAVGSQYLYVAAGNTGIVIYDLGPDKTSLIYNYTKTLYDPLLNVSDLEVHSVTTGGVTQESLYVAANNFPVPPDPHGRVLKYDLTASPALDADPVKIKAEIDVNALDVTDSFVYAAGQTALYVLDTQELGSGGVSGMLALASPALEISVAPSGNTAFLASSAGVDVIDVSTPTAPVKKTTIPFKTPTGYEREMEAAEFAGNSNIYLYMADFNAGLSIASAPKTAPQNLTLVGPSYIAPKTAIVRAVAGAFRQAFVFSDDSTLLTVNTTNPASLSVVGAGVKPDFPINSMTTYNSWLLASAGNSGLLRYQINPGSEPTLLDSFMTGGTAAALAVSWPNAVVADGAHGLVVVNINGTPSLTGWAPPPEFDSDFRRVEVQGNYAYVLDHNGALRIYDLTDPTGPVARGVWSQPGMLDLKVSGNHVFVADADSSQFAVTVLDVTDPDAPAFVTGIDFTTPGLAQNLALYDNYLFVSDGQDGVQMLSIRPSGQLALVTTIHTTGRAMQVTLVSGDHMYVADENGSLAVIRVPLLPSNRIYLPVIRR